MSQWNYISNEFWNQFEIRSASGSHVATVNNLHPDKLKNKEAKIDNQSALLISRMICACPDMIDSLNRIIMEVDSLPEDGDANYALGVIKAIAQSGLPKGI